MSGCGCGAETCGHYTEAEVTALRERAEAALRERDEARAERDRYLDTLLSRHGGEPIALLSELDEAREALRRLGNVHAGTDDEPCFCEAWLDEDIDHDGACVAARRVLAGARPGPEGGAEP